MDEQERSRELAALGRADGCAQRGQSFFHDRQKEKARCGAFSSGVLRLSSGVRDCATSS